MTKSPEQHTVDILNELGASPSYRGYNLIKTAVQIALNNTEAVHGITKEIYPVLSRKHKQTISAVQRNMNYICRVCYKYKHGDERTRNRVFGYRIRPLSNRMLVAVLAQVVEERMGNDENYKNR